MDRTDVVETICERIAEGEALVAICKEADLPSIRTFLRWANEDEKVEQAYRDALSARAEWYAAEHDRIRKTAVDRETAVAARVQLQALEWQMQRAAPKRYGERVDVKVNHENSLAAELEAARQRVLGLEPRADPVEIMLLEYSPDERARSS